MKRGIDYMGFYIGHSLKTGNSYPTKKEFLSRAVFLKEMAYWNRQCPQHWQYEEINAAEYARLSSEN